MNKQTEALKMAIEALDKVWDEADFIQLAKAINACKEALEQPNGSDLTYEELVSQRNYFQDLAGKYATELHELQEQPAQDDNLLTIAYMSGVKDGQKIKQPAQEPVAFRNKTTGEFCSGGFEAKHLDQWMPLYTHPAPAKPLSDEDIRIIDSDMSGEMLTADAWIIKFARAIEQALKEKNHG